MSRQSVAFETLVAYAAGELEPKEAAEVERHLAAHPMDAETARRLQSAVAVLRSDESIAPPAETLAAAKALFRERATQQQQQPESNWLSNLQRFVADVVFDSRLRPAVSGMRGAQTGFQLSFEHELADVDIEVQPVKDGPPQTRVIRGQVSPHGDATVSQVMLTEPGGHTTLASAAPDETGMFKLQVTAAEVDVLVTLGDRLLVVPDVRLE